MARYSLGLTLPTASPATDSPCATIHTASTEGIRITGMWFCALNGPANQQPAGLYRPSNTPVATTSVLGQAEDSAAPASVTSMDTAWSTAPTRGSVVPLRRGPMSEAGNFNNNVFAWDEDGGLKIPASGWLVLWNHNTGVTGQQWLWTVWWEE